MFLDDELDKIYEEYSSDEGLCKKLLDACVNRMPKAEDGVTAALVQLKRIDNAWRLFCKKHSRFKPDGFRNVVLKADVTGKFKKALNW